MRIETLNLLGIDTGLYKITVNGHAYETTRIYVDSCIDLAKESMKGKNAVVAVEKDRVIMTVNQPHKTAKQLSKTVTEYINMGYKVYKA